MRIGTKYCLTPEELKYCIKIGTQRYHQNLQAHVEDKKENFKKSSLDIDIQGVIGEFFILKFFLPSVDPSESADEDDEEDDEDEEDEMVTDHDQEIRKYLDNTSPNSLTRDRGDMIYRGFKIDIKCAEGGHHWPLKVRSSNRDHPADFYVLCTMKRLTQVPPFNLGTIFNGSFTEILDSNSSTYHETDQIELCYHGCVSSGILFRPCYEQNRHYVYPQKKLFDLKVVCHKNSGLISIS